jgi:hypothetical protein
MSIVLSVITDFNGKGISKAIQEFKTLKTNAERAQLAIEKAALPAALALGALGAAAYSVAKAAAQESASQTQLALQLRRSTGATTAQVIANEEFVNSLQYASAVSDEQLRPALSTLLVATKDLATAQSLLKTALDVSAATGKDVETVSAALSKGYAGNMRGLQQLSPEMKTAIKEGASFSEVLAILQSNFGGSAEAAANTAQGGFKKFQIALEDAKEEIGNNLLPIMAELSPMLVEISKFIGNNSVVVTIAVGAFANLAVSLLAAKAAMIIYNAIAAATTAFNTGLAISFTAVQVATVVGIGTAIAGAATIAVLAAKIRGATTANNEYATATTAAAGAQRNQNSALMEYMQLSMMEQIAAGGIIGFLKKRREAAAAEEKAQIAAQKASEKAAAASAALFSKVKDSLEKAKQSLRDYSASLKDNVNTFVNLSEAVGIANDSETTYNDALKERVAAYSALNALQQKGLYTTQEMADATQRVATAESELATAQSGRTNYSQQFQQQLAAAKKFAEQLKVLAPKLSRAAMAQVISLGPVAGSQVAADLISGTSAMTTESLNADLESLNQAGVGVGRAATAGDLSLLNSASVGKSGNNVYITVTSADPNAVVDALKRYMKTNGKVPIKVTN